MHVSGLIAAIMAKSAADDYKKAVDELDKLHKGKVMKTLELINNTFKLIIYIAMLFGIIKFVVWFIGTLE